MSATINPVVNVPTAQQPAMHVSNISAHPGSTWAGIGVIAMTVGQAMVAQGMPHSAGGWAAFLLPVAMGVGGMLGK
jgi:hypothetical protein